MPTNLFTDTVAEDMAEQHDIRQQRSQAVKTAWILGIVAGLIFLAFILSGVLGAWPGSFAD
jgi:hypothetical protein